MEGVLERLREALLLTRLDPTLTLPLAGEGTDLVGADVIAIAPSPAKRGKAGMGVRPLGEGASDKPKETK